MIFLRSTFFNIALLIITLVEGIFFLPWLFFAPKESLTIPRLWTRQILFLLRLLCGIRHEVKGDPALHKNAAYAIKHQSAWETFALWHILPTPVFVLKKELLNVPVFGWYLARTPIIAIDRKAGASAIKQIVEQAKAHHAQGRQIVIFPEGTRTPPGAKTVYHSGGISSLYRELGAPVIPTALNSGKFWGKNAWIKKPGIITLEFLPPIEPGLSKADFMNELQRQIEQASAKLL